MSAGETAEQFAAMSDIAGLTVACHAVVDDTRLTITRTEAKTGLIHELTS